MDLSQLSDADFQALQRGDLKAMSDAGFGMLIKAQERAMPMADKQARTRAQMAEQYKPTVGMSTGQLLAASAGKAVADTGLALQQAIPGSAVDRKAVDVVKRRDAPLMATTPGKVGYVLGSGAVGAPAMLAPGANTLLGSTMYGGLMGAMTPVGEEDSVLRNTAFGMGGGSAGYLASTGAAKALAPKVSQEARTMIDSGVTLTPGQRLGGGYKRFEDALTSLPFSGDIIKNQQRRAVEEFNAAVANSALKPIGVKLPEGVAGRDAVRFVENALGGVYESSLSRIKTVKADQALTSELANLKKMVQTSPMPGPVKDQFIKTIKNQITGKLQGQQSMTSQTFKDAESELGRLAALYGADASADKQLLGDALEEAQAAMRRWLERAAGPDVAGDVRAANQGWAEFKRMQRAASMLGAKDGVFSPENYLNAVKALDKSKDKGAFARGSALGQDRAEAAVKALGATVPDSGTPFRTLATNPVNGLVSMAATGLPVSAAYNRPVISALQTLMSGKRPALATKAAAELEAAAPLLRILGLTGAGALQGEN